ncbi:hypothetical protein [Nocardia fusca]|uniref:hypothetical protein n=1 Tax=Nocardia fusca TaxID=941183 RepID=UPI000AD7C5E7|nr:hypothetical protein [Nocardia fusca]
MGKRGDKKRAKQRAKQQAQSQRHRASNPAPVQRPLAGPRRERPAPGSSINRTSKWRGPVDPESPEGPLTPRKLSESEYLTVEWPAPDDAPENAPSIQFALKITERNVNLTRSTVGFKMTPVEDTIHPRLLSFDPPLQQYGREGAKGFLHHWEKLDYVFGLPDPYAFPRIPLQGDDRTSVERYITMSRRLAGFSIINDDTKMSVGRHSGTDEWYVRVLGFPADESFLGASAAFRQLHNDGEAASFPIAQSALFKAIGGLSEAQQSAIREVVPLWRAARGKLMNHTLQTLTALKASNATLDDPVSYGNIKPDELIRTFNYGDSLHFGDGRAQLDDLLADPFHEAYYKYGALISIVGLSHLYFGFAVLLASALGDGS